MFKVLVASLLFHSALSGSLVDVLKGDGETDLVDFIKQAGLADALAGGPFTVFAPTNAAFSKLPQATLNTLNTDFNALANILKYHVVQGNIHKADAKNELTLTTLAGTKIRFNIYPHNNGKAVALPVTGCVFFSGTPLSSCSKRTFKLTRANVVTVEGSKITNFDLNADNGVVHVIDTVMTPPSGSIVDIVAGNSDFSELLKLVKETGLVSALQGDGLTVFAPTNAAFQRLGSHVLGNLAKNPALLKEILEYHVVPHTEYSNGLYNREYLRTLDKHHDVVKLHISSSGIMVNNAHVTQADISATNGVVHVIDHVLFPTRHLFSILG